MPRFTRKEIEEGHAEMRRRKETRQGRRGDYSERKDALHERLMERSNREGKRKKYGGSFEAIRRMIRSGGKLPEFAWPGGYPMFYIMEGGDVVCPTCANKSHNINDVVAGDINYENDGITCDDCGKRIPSAYGDD
jgi:hypothetical protein